MKPKGFTLIELLAVIIILGVLVALISVRVTDDIRESKNKAYESLVSTIENATELYMTEHASEYDQINNYDPNGSNNIIYLNLGTLVLDKYLDEPIVDPRTKDEIPLTTQVKVTVKGTANIDIQFLYE